MSLATHQVNSQESEPLQIAALEIAQVRADLGKILAAHRQFGLEPAPGGIRKKVANLLKKATRRSMRWYTGNQHGLQGAIYRLLHDIAGILEDHQNALLDLGLSVEDIRGRLRAVECSLQQISMSGRIYPAVQEMDSPDPVVSQLAWDVNLPNTVTASDLFYCFRLLLGRMPDRDEWVAHYSRLGENLPQVVTAFLNSHEFAKRLLLERATAKWELVELTNFKMYVSPEDDYIGGSIIREGEYEPHMTRIFRQFVRPKMQVLDLGANMGYFSLLAASLVGPTGHVYSWEPSPENVKLLLASKHLNQFSNIEIVQAAGAAKSGLLKYFPNFSNGLVMEIGDERPEEAVSAETVMALRVDDYISRDAKIDFIKIDVEGFEYEALSGALDTIRRNLPIIATEFGPKALLRASGISGEEFLQFFIHLGYEISVIGKYNLAPRSIADMLRHYESSDVDHIDVLLRPRS